MSRRQFLANGTLLLVATVAWAGPAAAQARKVALAVGFQEQTLPALVEASKVLDNLPYDFQWVILPGPAAQLSALYSKAIDVGHMGDTSLIIEQGKAKTEWTEANAPLRIVAGWRNLDAKYPPIVTVVRTSSGIRTLEDLKGRKWAYNFGGFNYLQYVLSTIKAGLGPKDYEPVQFGDAQASAAAFNSGRVDAYSGGIVPVLEGLERGDARVVIDSDALDIPALGVWTARGDVIRDAGKNAALHDFLSRIRAFWAWYPDNLDLVEKIHIEKIKQTPARAKLSTEYLKSRFQPLDDRMVAREQRIADVLFDAGAIPRKIKVDVEFAREFNRSTGDATTN